ncbi:MAG: 23S rRNA (adenine(2503)-C(2))-methyltransferase RlmN [Planctomycetota bacterium]
MPTPSWPISAPQERRRFYLEGKPSGLVPAPTTVTESEGNEGITRKFLLPVAPAARDPETPLETESVIIPMRVRRSDEVTYTICVSSQVGCAMGCDFCETAQMGLIRSLEWWEIVQQWWAATHHLGTSIKNMVFMGMGEPLDNIENVLVAIDALTEPFGPAMPVRNITISTVGRAKPLLLLRDRVATPGYHKLNLAVSVNAPNDEIRSAIMPVNRATPMDELIDILEGWPLKGTRHIMAEYVLIPGVNDADEHADELADRLKNVKCAINVIPYNPRRDSPWPAPTEESVEHFCNRVKSHGRFVKRRRTKGRDTMAACGQLGNEQIRKRKLVQVRRSD